MDELPSSPAKWKELAIRNNLARVSIFDLDKYESASRIGYKQFLCLRVLWITKQARIFANDDIRQTWLRDADYSKAKGLLSSFADWQAYLNSCGTPVDQLLQQAFPDSGTFTLVQYHQASVLGSLENLDFTPRSSLPAHRTRSKLTAKLQGVTDTPTRPPRVHTEERDPFVTPLTQSLNSFSLSNDDTSLVPRQLSRTDVPDSASPPIKDIPAQYPSTDDELVVKAALILLLNAITMHFVPNADWTFHGKAFQIGKKKDGNGFEARVDGYLHRRSDDKVLAILDTQTCMRARQNMNLGMQESVQMAAWISHFRDDCTSRDSKGNFTRLLVSQDRHEIFLTFATFDKDYIEYVLGNLNVEIGSSEESNPGPFLRMNQFGPFITMNKSHMECLGCYVLAFVLQECMGTGGKDVVEEE